METNDQQDDFAIEDVVEESDGEGNDTTDWKAIALKNQGIAKRLKTKLAKKDESQEPKEEKKSDNTILQKAFLRSAGIIGKDEVELALSTAKKWGVEVDELVDDDDFKVKLEKMRTQKANIEATTGVKGEVSGSSVRETVEYWQAKGQPPTPADVPDKSKRVQIIKKMMELADTGGKKFYND